MKAFVFSAERLSKQFTQYVAEVREAKESMQLEINLIPSYISALMLDMLSLTEVTNELHPALRHIFDVCKYEKNIRQICGGMTSLLLLEEFHKI